MKFSIITPSFNQGRFITDCIESVMQQQGSAGVPPASSSISQDNKTPMRAGRPHSLEIEHIITDAGSTDETIDTLKRYPHLKWTSEPDNGMSDGINKGFFQATGDWVMWLNCDDFLLPGALKKVADFIESHPSADVVHGDCVFVEEDKTVRRRKYDTPVDAWDLLFVGCVIPSTSCFYRREIIDAGHVLDVGYKNTMDLEYYLRLMRQGYQFRYLPEPIAHFRWYNDSTTMKNWQRMIDEALRCKREHIDECNLPTTFKHPSILNLLRRIFQMRRVFKRFLQHRHF